MMIKAILLDMDNTLLVNPDMAFAKAFLAEFDQHMQSTLQVEKASIGFRQAIQAMSQTRNGEESNTVLTNRILSSHMQREIEATESALATFYAEKYPVLAHCVNPVTGAAELIHRLIDAGYKVVIATNPIYPEKAIKQRMEWANLPPDEKHYNLITSADNMHFAKPNPAYFAEILARIGVEPDEALVVGDSQRSDIIPAKTIGIHTYHLDEKNTLTNFAQNFENILANLAQIQHQPSMIEPQLRGNIGALFGLIDNVEPRFWHLHPDPNEWSIIQILCHLVSSENTHERPRLRRILQEDNPFITAPKPPGLQVDSCADEGFSVAYDFMQTRLETIEFLRTLSPEDWQKPAHHSIFGLTNLLEMAYFTAQHDRLHLNQLCETIGRCKN